MKPRITTLIFKSYLLTIPLLLLITVIYSLANGYAPLTMSLYKSGNILGKYYGFIGEHFCHSLLILSILIALLKLLSSFRTFENFKEINERSSCILSEFLNRWGLVIFIASAIISAGCMQVDDLWRNSTPFGYLPYRDSGIYYSGFYISNIEQSLPLWNCRRPPATLFYSLPSVYLSYGYLILLQPLLIATGSYALFRAASKYYGLAAGLFAGASMLRLGSYFTSSFQSESLGIFLGCVAAALLLHSAKQQKKLLWLIGLGFMSYALFIRAGCMLLLPLLSFGGLVIFKDKLLSRRILFFVLSFIMAASGMVLAKASIALYHDGEIESSSSNYSYTLYAIAKGPEHDWLEGIAYLDKYKKSLPPEQAAKLTDSEQNLIVHNKSVDMIKKSPLTFIWSLLARELYFITKIPSHLKYIHIPYWRGSGFFFVIWPGVLLVVLLRCLVWFKNREKQEQIFSRTLKAFFCPHNVLYLCLLLGMTLSAPFIMRSGGPRVFIATYPLLILFISGWLSTNNNKQDISKEPSSSDMSRYWGGGLFVLFTLYILLAPSLARKVFSDKDLATATTQSTQEVAKNNGAETIYLNSALVTKYTYVIITPDKNTPEYLRHPAITQRLAGKDWRYLRFDPSKSDLISLDSNELTIGFYSLHTDNNGISSMRIIFASEKLYHELFTNKKSVTATIQPLKNEYEDPSLNRHAILLYHVVEDSIEEH